MNKEIIKKIKERTEKIPLRGGRSEKKINYFDQLVFLPAQLYRRPIDYFREKISSKTILGKRSKRPIELETPIIIGAMSYGALSREAKIVLAKASKIAGTIANSGEGGVLKEERKLAQKLIVQYSTARFGINKKILEKADAVEIKIGQGAKPGFGGFLPKEKVTDEIAKIRKVKKGKDIHSPPFHPDIRNVFDLKKKIKFLRKITGGVPIIVKLAGGDIEKDLKLLLRADPDIIAIDGMEGGTGASPEIILNEVGLPTLISLVKAREILDKMKASQELLIGGGLNIASDFAKALALGADGVFIGTSLLIAMGCIRCGLCHLGKCPMGIATQDIRLRKKLDIEKASQKVASFIRNSTEEIKMIAAACGEKDIHKLNKAHLRALDFKVAKLTKVKLAGE